MPRSHERYSLITGASQGLGKAFAFELAKRKRNLILVALPHENLESLAVSLKKLGIKVAYYETDLTIKENLLELAEWVNKNFQLEILINNAGCGGTKRFIEAEVDYLDRIIQLNIRALSMLSRLLLPNLLQREEAYILNVSSMASFSPIGYKTIYPASKRFVQDFSRGLYQELKETSVHVSVVHPGPMKTNPDVTARIEQQGVFGKIGLLSVEKVAQIAIHKLLKKRHTILLGWFNHIVWFLMSLIPNSIKVPLISNTVKREIYFHESSGNRGE